MKGKSCLCTSFRPRGYSIISISQEDITEAPALYGRPASLDDSERLRTLHSTNLLHSPSLHSVDKMASLARELLQADFVAVSLLSHETQYHISQAGLSVPWFQREMPVRTTDCHLVVTSGEPLIVEDATNHPALKESSAVQNLGLCSYLGFPIVAQGEILGVFCVANLKPREWQDVSKRIVSQFAEMVSFQIELRLELARGYRLKMALEQSNRELKEFAQIATHDLKEPLRGVKGCLETALGLMPGLDSAPKELLQLASSSADRMSDLVTTLYAYSRLEEQAVKTEELEVNPLVEEVLVDIKPLVEERRATIEVGELGSTVANTVLLRQLVQNLVGNALKFAREGVPPRVEISRRGEVFTVADNGMGILEEDVESIFDPFKRGRVCSEPGTGIGLAICRRVVEKHQGKIWVESQSGQGSRFHFCLCCDARL